MLRDRRRLAGRRVWKLGIFCIAASALSAFRAWPLTPTASVAAILLLVVTVGFFVLLAFSDPDNGAARICAYICGVAVTQGYPIALAISVLYEGNTGKAPTPTGISLLLRCIQAGISVAAFYVVKAWTDGRVHRPEHSHAPSGRTRPSWWAIGAVGGATSLSFVSEFPATTIRLIISAITQTDFSDTHTDTGNTADWWIYVGTTALAGAVEEPIYVGLAVLLWPYRGSIRQLVPVAIITSAARSLLHVYYAVGQPHPVGALLAVFGWCAVWSTINLAITYHMKSLVPVIVGHGLWNIFVTNDGDWDIQGPLAVATHFGSAVVTWLVVPAWFIVFASLWLFRWLQRRAAPTQVDSPADAGQGPH